jgi:hypothetical protein
MTNAVLGRLLRTFPAAFVLLMAGCGGSADSSSNNAQIRVLNVSSAYDSLDLYSSTADSATSTKLFSAVAQGTVTSYAALKGDSYTLTFRKSGTTGDLLSSSATLAQDTHATLVGYGATNNFAVLSIDDDVDNPSSGYTKVYVLNTVSTESFDVYLTGASDSLDDVSATVAALAAGKQSSVATVSSGNYRLRITATGNKADLRLNVPEITLPSAGVVSIILTETTGGVLVNAVVLPKQGQPTSYDNTATAMIRVLNVSDGYSSIDLYSKADSANADTQLFASVARGSATAYTALKADSYALKFRKSGAAGDLLSLNATLAEDKHITYVTYGASGGFAVAAIDDEIEAPNSSYTKLQVLNATTADSLDIYLTGTNDALQDVAPTVSAAAPHTMSAITTVASGSYRLRITASGSKTDVRLDVPALSLASTGVVSIIASESASGVLLNAVALPQQGAPVNYNNSNVRIRGAAGLATGAMVTINVSDTDIVTRRSARSYISDTYTTLAAGTVAVTVTVDNASVVTGFVTLEAGKDYTLLAWDGGGPARLALINDNNHASTSHRAKLRLVNGLSGAVVPLTLSVNYSPVSEYIEVGTSSDPAEIPAGTDYRLDITSAETLATLLTRDSVTLVSDGVYSLFVAGGGSSAITATLRKDR